MPPTSGMFSRLLLCCAALSFPTAPLVAQGEESEPPKLWRRQLDLGLNSASGNTSLTTLITGASLKRLETEAIELELSASYRYGRSDGKTVTNILVSTLKVDINPKDLWSPFIFASSMRNPVRRVNLRSSGGSGAKYTFWRSPKGKSSVSFAAIYNYESFEAQAGQEVATEQTVRWSARAKFNYTFGEGVAYEHITFYQPDWDRAGDYYVIINNSVRVPVGGGLSLRVNHEFQHDETPAPGVSKDDSFLSVAFRYVF